MYPHEQIKLGSISSADLHSVLSEAERAAALQLEPEGEPRMA